LNQRHIEDCLGTTHSLREGRTPKRLDIFYNFKAEMVARQLYGFSGKGLGCRSAPL
jgi:hypothetical protein